MTNIFKLILIFILTISTPFNSFAQEITQEKEIEPKIRMGGDGNVTLPPGEKTTVEIPIINTAQGYAYDLLIQAKPEKNSPFTINFLEGSNRKNIIERVGSTKTILSFDVDKNAPSGTYPVVLEFSYTSSNRTSLNNSDTFYVKIDNTNILPSVVLNNFSSNKDKVLIGEDFNINLDLVNTSKVDTKNVSIQVLGLDDSNISLIGDANTVYFDNFKAGDKKNLNFKFLTNTKTKEGSNKLNFKVSFSDKDGKEYQREFQYYILINKSSSENQEPTNLSIVSISEPKQTLNVNQNGTFTLKVKNEGKNQAKNVKITTKIPEGLVPTSSSVIVLPNINPNEEKTISFSVSPTSQAKTQVYSVGFNLEYQNQADDKQNINLERYAGVKVNNPTPTSNEQNKKTSVPKVIISKYQSTPMIVEAGKPFELAMEFTNTHSSKTIKNIKLYLTVDDKTEEKGNVFAPNNSSTTFYINEIKPNSKVSHIFNLFTVPDAKPRSYTINVNFEYEDENANEYKTTELVGITVKQQSKIETSEIKIQDEAFVGDSIFANFQIYNTGKVTVSNLKVSIEGDGFDTTSTTNFIGNLQSGSSEYYESSFVPNEVGEKLVKVDISYEDTNGEVIQKTHEFKINVKESELAEPTFNENTEDENNFNNNNLIINFIIAFIIIAVIIFLFIKKKIKRKKEFDFNE